MLVRSLYSLAYVLPATAVALIALHAAASLAGIFRGLKGKAAEQGLGVPPLVQLYFRSATRTLFVSGVLFVLLAAGDLAVHVAERNAAPGRLLGYGSGMVLLVCGFALLLQGGVDRHLKLLSAKARLLHAAAGLAGIATACWGMALVTWKDAVWGF